MEINCPFCYHSNPLEADQCGGCSARLQVSTAALLAIKKEIEALRSNFEIKVGQLDQRIVVI